MKCLRCQRDNDTNSHFCTFCGSPLQNPEPEHKVEPAALSIDTLLKQLQALQACWEEARAGRGQLAFVTGEPGIGKTCLALQVAAQGESPVLLVGRCQELPSGSAYHAFTQVLRSYFATIPSGSLDEQSRQLIGNFAQLVPEIRQMMPDLPVPPPLE